MENKTYWVSDIKTNILLMGDSPKTLDEAIILQTRMNELPNREFGISQPI